MLDKRDKGEKRREGAAEHQPKCSQRSDVADSKVLRLRVVDHRWSQGQLLFHTLLPKRALDPIQAPGFIKLAPTQRAVAMVLAPKLGQMLDEAKVHRPAAYRFREWT